VCIYKYSTLYITVQWKISISFLFSVSANFLQLVIRCFNTQLFVLMLYYVIGYAFRILCLRLTAP
jgi:hypothetical protein